MYLYMTEEIHIVETVLVAVDDCCVCLEKLEDCFKILPCKHKIHLSCMVGKMKKCPLCRLEIPYTICKMCLNVIYADSCGDCEIKELKRQNLKLKTLIMSLYNNEILFISKMDDIHYLGSSNRIDSDTVLNLLISDVDSYRSNLRNNMLTFQC